PGQGADSHLLERVLLAAESAVAVDLDAVPAARALGDELAHVADREHRRIVERVHVRGAEFLGVDGLSCDEREQGDGKTDDEAHGALPLKSRGVNLTMSAWLA